MAQIMFPKKQVSVDQGRESGAGTGQKLGAAIGGVAGLLSGGPIGAVKGAASGASIGGTLGGLAQPGQQGSVSQPQQTQGIQTAQGNAIDRRISEIEQNPHFALQQAKASLSQLPTEIQQQYAPTIEMALEASRRAQKVGMA